MSKPRLGDRLLGFFGLRLVVWLLAAQAFLPGVLFDPPHNVAHYHDEHNAVMHEEAARRTYVEHHELPAWEPYFCGGIVGLSNAPSDTVAPDFLLRIVYGTLVGRRLAVLLFVLIGMEGTFRYARKNGASALGAAAGAVAFSTSGHFVSLLGWGWIFMFHYNLIPWIALSFEEGIRKKWWIVIGGFFMAWLILGGGTYVAPYTCLVLLLLWINETVRLLRPPPDGTVGIPWYRPTLVLLAMAAVTIGLSAIRLFPLLELLATHSRPVQQKDLTGPLSAIAMVALPKERASWATGAGEFYVGSWIVIVAVLALLTERRSAKFWAIAILFGAFACGEFIDDAPYLWLRKLPLFSQLRFPNRMLTVTALFVALAASFGFTRIEDTARVTLEELWSALPLVGYVKKWLLGGAPQPPPATAKTNAPLAWRVIVALVTTGAVAWLATKSAQDVFEHNTVAKGSLYSMPGPLVSEEGFKQSRGNRWDAHVWPFVNRGSLHCFEEHELFESPYLRGDLPAEEYGAPETSTQVERLRWSPHEIVLRVKASGEGGRFLVNQNHANAWKTDVGTLTSDGGLISVRVPPGEHVVTLRYSDWKIRLGAIVTFATSLAIAIALFKRARKRFVVVSRFWRLLPTYEQEPEAKSAADAKETKADENPPEPPAPTSGS